MFLRRLCHLALIPLSTFLISCRDIPVSEVTTGEPLDVMSLCDAEPQCWPYIEAVAAQQRALADWYVAVTLADFYDALIGGDCGGELPPCYVMERESGGSLTAENPVSTAAGKWQMLLSTSNNVARAMGRYDLVDVPASHWTEMEQDEGARLLWNMGAGCSHWRAC